QEWKRAKKEGIEYPRGCSYNNIRIGLRSFFTLMLGITAAQLTLKGIGAEHSDGFGKLAKEMIPKEKRHGIIRDMKIAATTIINNNIAWNERYADLIPSIVSEMKGLCYFMFYTATRITATLETTFNDPENKYDKDIWEIHIIDKGKFKTGRQEWQKRLIGHALDTFREYVSERFNIPIEDLEENASKTLRDLDKPLFPIMHDQYRLEIAIMNEAQNMNGLKYKQQNHIWRHTFAQEWLEVMKGNYEVGAEVGGWKDIGTMKRANSGL
ncbi:unnamed protein product, partial [marine sediment metagenome]